MLTNFSRIILINRIQFTINIGLLAIKRELKHLGLLIHMGLSQFPRLEYHWLRSSLYNCHLCPTIMTKKDFFLLHGFLHFADNRSANLDDKLYKVRRLFELLTQRFQRYYILNRELTIDERIVKYTGRLSFLQSIRSKPNQFGIKVFILADALTGYVYNWKIYTGAERHQNMNRENENSQRSQPVIQKTVMELTNNLANLGHIVCFDSNYSYIQIFQQLARKSIGCIGTLNKARRGIPDDIKSPNLGARESVFRRNGNIMALAFKEKTILGY